MPVDFQRMKFDCNALQRFIRCYWNTSGRILRLELLKETTFVEYCEIKFFNNFEFWYNHIQGINIFISHDYGLLNNILHSDQYQTWFKYITIKNFYLTKWNKTCSFVSLRRSSNFPMQFLHANFRGRRSNVYYYLLIIITHFRNYEKIRATCPRHNKTRIMSIINNGKMQIAPAGEKWRDSIAFQIMNNSMNSWGQKGKIIINENRVKRAGQEKPRIYTCNGFVLDFWANDVLRARDFLLWPISMLMLSAKSRRIGRFNGI